MASGSRSCGDSEPEPPVAEVPGAALSVADPTDEGPTLVDEVSALVDEALALTELDESGPDAAGVPPVVPADVAGDDEEGEASEVDDAQAAAAVRTRAIPRALNALPSRRVPGLLIPIVFSLSSSTLRVRRGRRPRSETAAITQRRGSDSSLRAPRSVIAWRRNAQYVVLVTMSMHERREYPFCYGDIFPIAEW